MRKFSLERLWRIEKEPFLWPRYCNEGRAIAMKKQIVVDFSDTCSIDAGFLGLLLMLRKKRDNGASPIFIGL
jgi:hypothetical protein